MTKAYIFKSDRLGFRNWTEQDLTEFAKINSDPEVMKHFPKPLSKQETAEFIERLRNHYETYGYNYFATELLESGELLGFIGLAFQNYQTKYTPAVDIGWRLKRDAWGKGFATEGAKRCLEFAFKELNLKNIISTCTERNAQSENVMKKIGMKKIGTFKHPKLKGYPHIEQCICYAISNNHH